MEKQKSYGMGDGEVEGGVVGEFEAHRKGWKAEDVCIVGKDGLV